MSKDKNNQLASTSEKYLQANFWQLASRLMINGDLWVDLLSRCARYHNLHRKASYPELPSSPISILARNGVG
jgi:hypothetical protein